MAKLNMSILASVVAAGAGGMFGPAKEAAAFVEAGFMEINPGVVDADGNVLVRATEAGIQEIGNDVDASANSFPIGAVPADVLEAAKTRRSAGRKSSSRYPFAQLEVGQGFFVPATEKMPDPAKSLSSAITGAQRQFAEDTGETETKTVAVYQLDENGKRVRGDDGKLIKTGEEEKTSPVMKNTRVFKASPAEGGAWIVRTA